MKIKICSHHKKMLLIGLLTSSLLFGVLLYAAMRDNSGDITVSGSQERVQLGAGLEQADDIDANSEDKTSDETENTNEQATAASTSGSGQTTSNQGDSGSNEEPQEDPAPAQNFCSTFPALPSSKPTRSNTGVPSGTTLTASGSLNISADGTVIDGKDITGDVYINANNVTIKNSKIHSTGESYIAVRVVDGKTGTKILHSEIYTSNGGYEGIIADNATICGNYIHGFDNAMTIGGNTIVQANYIDRLDSAQVGPHYDGIEVYSGSNTKIWGNNILMTDTNDNWLSDTGAINITAEYTSISNVEVRGNWIGGGSYTLYVRYGSFTYSSVQVTNNTWYGSSPKGYAQWGPISDDGGVTYAGNKWENGDPI